MTTIYIIIAVLILLNVLIIRIYLRLGKHCPNHKDDESQFYDDNGNHIYYDRKLIAQLEKEKQSGR